MILPVVSLNRLIPGLAEHQVTVFLFAGRQQTSGPPLQHLEFVEQDLLNGLIAPLLDSGALGARECQAFSASSSWQSGSLEV